MLEMNTGRKGRGKASIGKKTGSVGPKKTTIVKKTSPVKNNTDSEGKSVVFSKPTHKPSEFKKKERKGDPMPTFNDSEMRLNKYLSISGVASRREADVLIQSGVISVNDVIITEMGYKIHPSDVVKYDGQTINAEKKRYVILNKPKGFIATMDDPFGRKTVMQLVYKACRERIYPVGKLEKDTTGLLLFTNDGDLEKKLTHPRYRGIKLYHVELNNPISFEQLDKLTAGIHLEEGYVKCEKAELVKNGNPREIGVEINVGDHRTLRKLIEKLGFEVTKLDRVKFANLTKKDLPRGHYRHLTEKEVAFLKMS
jgi:23S rRNA pseudouridine2605 synthase